MNGILLDLGVVIAEIILFLIAITVGQFLIILTLKRLAQWVPEKQGQNPLNLTQKILNKSLFVIKITGAIIIAALNGYLFLQQKSPYLYLLDLINGISPEQWQRLALGLLKSVLLLLLVSLMIASLRPRLKRAGDRLKAWKNIEGNNHSLDTLFKAIDLAIANGLWIWPWWCASIFCLSLRALPNIFISRSKFIFCFALGSLLCGHRFLCWIL